MITEQTKVAVKCTPYVTKAGYTTLKYFQFRVAAGADPLGPRGGFGTGMVDGEYVSRAFRERAKAVEFAKDYAAKNGFEFLG